MRPPLRVLALLLLGPSLGLGQQQPPADPGKGGGPMNPLSTPAVEMKIVSVDPGRPPLVRLGIDTVLRNHGAHPRWFLLPTHVPPTPGNGGVDVLEVYASEGTGKVIVGRFLGTGGFQAFLVPAGGEVTYRKQPVSLWADEPVDSISLDVLIVRDLTIGGAPARDWYASDPTCDARADVSRDKEKMLSSRKSPDGKERPVAYSLDERVRLRLELPR
jgi:hypothetical protein